MNITPSDFSARATRASGGKHVITVSGPDKTVVGTRKTARRYGFAIVGQKDLHQEAARLREQANWGNSQTAGYTANAEQAKLTGGLCRGFDAVTWATWAADNVKHAGEIRAEAARLEAGPKLAPPAVLGFSSKPGTFPFPSSVRHFYPVTFDVVVTYDFN